MKKLIGLSDEEVSKIGKLIGEAYYAEDDPMIRIFDSKEDGNRQLCWSPCLLHCPFGYHYHRGNGSSRMGTCF